MKKPPNVSDLAATLTQAATAPLVPPAVAAQPAHTRRRGSIAVMLKIPPDLHARLDHEAVSRTKETGKGVTVQQVILEKLAGAI
jgi:hypothetical protein